MVECNEYIIEVLQQLNVFCVQVRTLLVTIGVLQYLNFVCPCQDSASDYVLGFYSIEFCVPR